MVLSFGSYSGGKQAAGNQTMTDCDHRDTSHLLSTEEDCVYTSLGVRTSQNVEDLPIESNLEPTWLMKIDSFICSYYSYYIISKSPRKSELQQSTQATYLHKITNFHFVACYGWVTIHQLCSEIYYRVGQETPAEKNWEAVGTSTVVSR